MKKTINILSYFFLFISVIHAQQFEFSHLSNANGLSNNQIECIFKDSRGFVWFGTNIGLNRYDGINFKIYKHNPNDPSSIPSDRFTDIQEDVDGNLWLFSGSYTVYDWKSERFILNTDSLITKMKLPASPTIIEIDHQKNFYAYYRGKGIYRYDAQTHEITWYKQADNSTTLRLSEIKGMQISENYIWVLHQDGVVERLNMNIGIVDICNTYFRDKDESSTIIKSLFIDSDNDLWIYPGIADKGAGCYDIKEKQWKFLDTGTKPSLSSSFVRAIIQDKDGFIWIGTDHGGINVLDKKKQIISVLKNNIYDETSISQNTIISLFCDQDGVVWAGTYKKGISYYHPNMFKFKKNPLYYTSNQNAETFDCNSLYKDGNNNLWIGTNGRGLVMYNTKTGESRIFRNNASDPTSISSDIITSIFEDHRNILWIGTFLGGLNAYNGRGFKRYQINENNANSLSSRSVYGLTEDNDHNLWIGTLGGGVDKLDPERQTFTHYNIDNNVGMLSDYVLSMYTDPLKNIYLGTDQGVSIIDKDKKQISHYFSDQTLIDSLTNLGVNNLIQDSRGLLWIATNRGVNIYNPYKKQITWITANNGLVNEEVVSLIEDNDGNIWAGTRQGLACMYCKFENNTLAYTIALFDVKDGLPSSTCNQNAIFKDKEGLIYVGTINGYTCFNPRDIVFNKRMPAPLFTDLLIENQIIRPNIEYDGRIIIEESITNLKEITLNYGETNFTILFSALNLIHPEKSRYRYMLDGLDNKWTEITDGVGAASYSNLNPGTYRLLVYASNDDNVWTETPIVLKITINPPFWLSWWAYLIYIIVIAAIIRWYLKYKLNKQRAEYEQAQRILEVNKIHEVDELKFKFFTNISHEFKTPLTLILTPLEKLLKSPVSEDQKATLSIMYKNALSLLSMVNDILDFRKFDLNKMVLNVSRGDVISFTRDICQSFSSLAMEKSIKLTFTTYLEELQMEFDKEKMNKIISNLISNAFKYTEEGHIDVSISVSELFQNNENVPTKRLCIKVSDTGIGIEPQYKDKIFERFFRIENTERSAQSGGAGVGLHLVSEYVKLHNGDISVESSLSKGSVFTVLIPINNTTYKELSNQDIIHAGQSNNIKASVENRDAENVYAQKMNLPLLLIVDDNEDFCEFVKSLFVENYRIVTANDGEEGYSIVLDQLPDIILCDVMMPKIDGYEFCRKVKNDIRTSHIPIILLTARSSEENKYEGIEAGADDYISKPFNIDMLRLKIAKIIEKQKVLHSSFKKKIDVSLSDIEITTMDEKFVKKAVTIVEKNIGDADFLVEDLCKEMGMSRVYFYKKILALTDKTPSEFIRFIRLKRAADLLEKSQMFVNEIAFQVGFNDPKYFRKYFKEEFGTTPNEYKKKASGEG